jgi:hypothetical protein
MLFVMFDLKFWMHVYKNENACDHPKGHSVSIVRVIPPQVL